MQERETKLSKNSFASDLQVFSELDELAGTSGARSFDRQIFLQFLRLKGWIIEEVAEALEPEPDVEPDVQPTIQSAPKIHIVFPSSSSESGSQTEEKKTRDDDGDEDDDGDDHDYDDDDDDDKDSGTSDRAFRSVYVGRGNVQAVRAARKQAGLNESFSRSDPLLKEFADYLKVSGAAVKDIANKVIKICQSLV